MDNGRLNNQFNLITKCVLHILLNFLNAYTVHRAIGFHIHPSIASKLPPNAHIADIATGTGIYLTQLGESWPEATLDGYDLSAVQYPEATSLPGNVELKFLDVKKPVPQELEGTYDLVHVRLLSAAMLAPDWNPVVKNLAKLLKPGGALQWEECNFLAATQVRSLVGSTYSAIQKIEELLLDAFRVHFVTGWNTLPREMTDSGLVNVQHDVVSSDREPETRADITKNSMVACFGWARSGKDPVPLSPADIDELEHQAYKDIESGGYVRYDIHTTVGFRAEA
jgi:SAM-dependent methyltransferase